MIPYEVNIKKGNMSKKNDLKSFLGGIEPTGKFTIEQGSKSKPENRKREKNLATAGGALGGYAAGAGLSGLALMGAGIAAKARNPASLTGRGLIRSGKSSAKSLNPAYSAKTLKRTPEASGIVRDTKEVIDRNVRNLSGPVTRKSEKITPDTVKTDAKKYTGAMRRKDKFVTKYDKTPGQQLEEGAGVISGLVTGGVSGAIGGVSARAQYGAGEKLGKGNNEKTAHKVFRKLANYSSKQDISRALVREQDKYNEQMERHSRGEKETKEEFMRGVYEDAIAGTIKGGLAGATLGWTGKHLVGLKKPSVRMLPVGAVAGTGLGFASAAALGGKRFVEGRKDIERPTENKIQHYQKMLDSFNNKTKDNRMSKKAEYVFEKLAGSDLSFYPGKGVEGERFSPSTAYHYKAQGKYSDPSLPISSVSDKEFGKSLEGSGRFISPEEAGDYIKAYDKSVRSPHPYRSYSEDELEEVPAKRNLIEKLLRKEKTEKRPTEKTVNKKLSDPEFQQEHKKTLEWMKGRKDKGFTVNVG